MGKIYHYRATYLQDWGISTMLVVGGKLGWRIDKDLAGGGASVDAASHLSVVEADIQVALEHHKYAFDPGGADRGILVCR